jgi:hypothetical protein
VRKGEVDRLLAAPQLVGGQGSERLSQRTVLRAHFSAGLAHLIEGLVERVVTEERLQLDWMACGHRLRVLGVSGKLSWRRIWDVGSQVKRFRQMCHI